MRKSSAPRKATTLEQACQDLQALAVQVAKRRLIHLTGDRLVMPTAGTVNLYFVPTVSTAASSGTEYHTVQGMRSGQAENGLTVDTQNAELTAYQEYSLGAFQVGKGDVLAARVTVTGSPWPLLSSVNIVLRCVLSPSGTEG